MNHTRQSITEEVLKFIKEEIYVEELQVENTFEEIGLDSLDVIKVAIDLEEEYNITINDGVIEQWETIKDIIDSVEMILNID